VLPLVGDADPVCACAPPAETKEILLKSMFIRLKKKKEVFNYGLSRLRYVL
jgi:hypothetical protein